MSLYKLPKMRLKHFFMGCYHNHPCSICRTNYSVLDLDQGVMLPCWSCQKTGYRTFKFKKNSLMVKLIDWAMQ